MAEKIGDESIYLRIAELKKGKIQFSDVTNAERFVRDHGEVVRYNSAWKKWLVWNGRYWATDESGALVHEKGLETVRNLYDELAKTGDYRERIDIEKHAILSESVRRREATIRAVQWKTELNIKSEDLDKNPWLINLQNGTMDVSKGEFREHRKEEMIAKIANVAYDHQADCPLWKQFIVFSL